MSSLRAMGEVLALRGVLPAILSMVDGRRGCGGAERSKRLGDKADTRFQQTGCRRQSKRFDRSGSR